MEDSKYPRRNVLSWLIIGQTTKQAHSRDEARTRDWKWVASMELTDNKLTSPWKGCRNGLAHDRRPRKAPATPQKTAAEKEWKVGKKG